MQHTTTYSWQTMLHHVAQHSTLLVEHTLAVDTAPYRFLFSFSFLLHPHRFSHSFFTRTCMRNAHIYLRMQKCVCSIFDCTHNMQQFLRNRQFLLVSSFPNCFPFVSPLFLLFIYSLRSFFPTISWQIYLFSVLFIILVLNAIYMCFIYV